MLGLLAITYNRDPIIPIYFVSCSSSLSSSVVVAIAVLFIFASFLLNFFSSAFMYFYWWVELPDEDCLIWSPKKKLSSPIMFIYNLFLISSAKSAPCSAYFPPKIMSSRYTWTMSILEPWFLRTLYCKFCILITRVQERSLLGDRTMLLGIVLINSRIVLFVHVFRVVRIFKSGGLFDKFKKLWPQ